MAARFRPMDRTDATAVWRLARATAELDRNSHYLYVALGTFFGETCTVAETDTGELAGFVTGFRPPTDPATLFIWQLAVAAPHRGQGLARALVAHTLDRQDGVDAIVATIAPDNLASQGVFGSLAAARGWALTVEPFLTSADLPVELSTHPDEQLFRIARPGD